MSLLLDALKRAEDAKRAKAEAASGSPQATPDNVPAQPPAETSAEVAALSPEALDAVPAKAPAATESIEPPPAIPVLSLESVESRSADAASQIGRATATTPIPEAIVESKPPLPAMTMEELLASELGVPAPKQTRQAPIQTSAATAAFRATRSSVKTEGISPSVEKPALELFAIESAQENVATRPEPPKTASPPPSSAVESSNREAVKNAFAVKQAAKPNSKAKWALPLIAVLLSGLGAGGWYVWNEMNRFSRPGIARSPAPMPANAAPKPAPTDVAIATPPQPNPTSEQTAVAATAKPAEAAPEVGVDAPLPPLLPPPATQLREARAPIVAKMAPMTPREAIVRGIEALPPMNAEGAAKVKLTLARSTVEPQVSPALTAGYVALSSGDYPLAKRRYAEAIAANTNSADAHLGFATAAARGGEAADLALAVRHYQRVLEIDPRNSTANAALIVLAGGGSTNGAPRSVAEQEGALRMIVSQDPSAANAHFLLGNLYAENRRWRDAQQAYFEAARLQPQNADYNYNLAVSLDHLGQGAAAADFYKRALAATSKGQFDTAAVDRRIRALSTKPSAGTNEGSVNR